MTEPDNQIERNQLSIQLCRLFGFDLSILKGMTVPQLRHLAQVSASRLSKLPQEPLPGPGGEAEGEQSADAMPADEKVRKAVAYFDRYSEPLTRLGFSRRAFAEGYKSVPAKLVRRLL